MFYVIRPFEFKQKQKKHGTTNWKRSIIRSNLNRTSNTIYYSTSLRCTMPFSETTKSGWKYELGEKKRDILFMAQRARTNYAPPPLPLQAKSRDFFLIFFFIKAQSVSME